MYIVIEEFQYDSDDIGNVLWEGAFQTVEGKISINYVGYYFNPRLADCVFVLPKVLLNRDGLVFDRLHPRDILHVDKSKSLTETEREFLYGFSVWVYRAIRVYHDSHPGNGIIYNRCLPVMDVGTSRRTSTYLDVILALIDFSRRNQDFLFFAVKNRHSGVGRVDWDKTVDRKEAFLTDEGPVYADLIVRKKQVDFDEELLVIYYSILEYLRVAYGFPIRPSLNYQLITGERFSHLRNGYGTLRLKQIRYKYYSDKALLLWSLCYAFFDRSQQVHVTSHRQEYLLAKNFNIVFEAIIDDLVGDRDVPLGLREQEDGKRVDHLYLDESLTYRESNHEKVYYLGDSKYYKQGNVLGREAVSKQFTYARNVIQWNLNLFLDAEDEDEDERKVRSSDRKVYEQFGKIRDDVTEGYNIVPNFFISAYMDKGLSYANDEMVEHTGSCKAFQSRQFENRLFDRDTLLLSHYDVNFLFVLALYARNNQLQKAAWKSKVRSRFRASIRELLSRQYDFYVMTPRQGASKAKAEAFLREDFQKVLGKVYSPYAGSAPRSYYSLALSSARDEKTARENSEVLAHVSKIFVVEKCPLGENPSSVLTADKIAKAGTVVPDEYLSHLVLYGTYHGREQWRFIVERGIYHMPVESAAQQGIADDVSAAERKRLFLVPDPRSTCKSTTVLEIEQSLGKLPADALYALGWKRARREEYFVWEVKVM